MNRSSPHWLLPCAIVGYVALSAFETQTGTGRWFVLLWPLALGLLLRWVHQKQQTAHLLGSERAARFVLFGAALYGAAFFTSPDSAGFLAARTAALLALTSGTLLFIARTEPPQGLVRGHPAAQSLDALALAACIWSLLCTAALARTLFPELIPLDPVALDTAFVFAVLGSLLLFIVAEGRVLLLRGLELGVADRARAGLTLSFAGTMIAWGAAFLRVASPDQALGLTLVLTSLSVCLTRLLPRAAQVTQWLRATLALLLLGTPVALGGAALALHSSEHPAAIALGVAALSIVVGLTARSLSRPLGPDGSRWLLAMEQAMDAALHPEPDQALRDALLQLQPLEPSGKHRPEIYRLDPPGLLAVDWAGNLLTDVIEFPTGVLDFALAEPAFTLRNETVQKAQVRNPALRPIAAWFSAREAQTATALLDEEGAVGLLVLPRGKRRAHLSLEEAENLAQLSRRLAGLLSVNSALARSRKRELHARKEAELAQQEAEKLTQQLSSVHHSHTSKAELWSESLRVAGHSPAVRLCLQALEEHSTGRSLALLTPPGVDPRPYAAHYHLLQEEPQGPLVFLDASLSSLHHSELYQLDPPLLSSPLRRAEGGTLLIQHVTALPPSIQQQLALLLPSLTARLLVSHPPTLSLHPDLKRALAAPELSLPPLHERGEDLQSLIIFELSRLSLAQRGEPLGITRSALIRLTDALFPGNEEELRGLLCTALARAEGALLTEQDLFPQGEPPLPLTDPAELPESESLTTRTRARRAPRARR